MKKILVRILIVLVVLGVVALLAVYFSLNGIITTAFNKVAPKVTQVDSKIAGATVSVFSGSGSIKKLFIGNPSGYKSEFAIRVDNAKLTLVPRSILGKKIIVEDVNVKEPEVTFEGSFTGNNLNTILANVEKYSDTGAKTPTTKEETTKLQVNHFILTGGKIRIAASFAGGSGVTLPMPDIEFRDLGTGPEGITAGELAKVVGKKLVATVVTTVTQNLDKLPGEAKDMLNGIKGTTTETIQKTREGIKGIFKR